MGNGEVIPVWKKSNSTSKLDFYLRPFLSTLPLTKRISCSEVTMVPFVGTGVSTMYLFLTPDTAGYGQKFPEEKRAVLYLSCKHNIEADSLRVRNFSSRPPTNLSRVVVEAVPTKFLGPFYPCLILCDDVFTPIWLFYRVTL